MTSVLKPSTSVVDEVGLALFRAHSLDPSNVLTEVKTNGTVLLQAAIGTGKSYLVDGLLSLPDTFDTYDLLIYVVPQHSIASERAILTGSARPPVAYVHLKGRPTSSCGPLDTQWHQYESQGLSALGKEQLCKACPMASDCSWPTQLSKKVVEEVRLFFVAEAYFKAMPSLVKRLKQLTDTDTALVIFDEAKFLGEPLRSRITATELNHYRKALCVGASKRDMCYSWITEIDNLLIATANDLADRNWSFSGESYHTISRSVQEAGLKNSGTAFRELGYLLQAFAQARPEDRSTDGHGNITFGTRPLLDADVLILAANLPPAYVKHRLRLDTIHAPFDGVSFRHSGTTIMNIKSYIGAKTWFDGNEQQILDFFGALIKRNIENGKSTLLVAKKDTVGHCSSELTSRLASWGVSASFPTTSLELYSAPNPQIVPIIHYGVIGINTFTDYDACYCLNSYYINQDILTDQLFEIEQEEFRGKLTFCKDSGNTRYVETPEKYSHSNLADNANIYAQAAEIDPILQAVGRVRFYTKPREVIFFTTHDIRPYVGDVTEFQTLAAARLALEVPRAKDLRHAFLLENLLKLGSDGMSMREAANQLGISKSTAYALLQ